MKIRTKLIVVNFLIVLILLSVLTYVLMKRSGDVIFDTVIENASLSLSQVSVNLDNMLYAYEEVANTLYLNDKLEKILLAHYDDLRDAYDQYFDQMDTFSSVIRSTKGVALKIYTTNPTFVFADILLIDDEITSSSWYQMLMTQEIGGYWTAPYYNINDNDPVFSFRKRLNHYYPDSKMVANVEVRVSVLHRLINEERKGKRYIFSLPDGNVLVDTGGESSVSRIQDLPFYNQITSSNQGSFPYEEGTDSYQVIYQTLHSRNVVSGMKVIAFVPLTDLMPKIHQIRSLSFILFIITCCISAVLISIFSVGMTRRISELTSKMRRVDKDHFQTSIEVKGNDEISQLGVMFNVMVRRIDKLIHDVYMSEIGRKEMALNTKEVELYALQTQINPHFLFNVLNMIRGKLLISGDRENAKIVGLLAKSFRMMLQNKGQTIHLAEEIAFIDIYLQLQKYRYTDRLHYSIDIPVELQDVDVPKLCLQPLVENAITHGIELKQTRSTIVISGVEDGDDVIIMVEDDGQGISPERLLQIQEWLSDDQAIKRDTHIGLQNVNQRLKYVYGDRFGLKVESVLGEGTKITMRIPRQSRKDGEQNV